MRVDKCRNCRKAQPLALSHPHLCFADKIVKNKVSGLHPDPAKHVTKYYVEPISGVPVKVSRNGNNIDSYTESGQKDWIMK